MILHAGIVLLYQETREHPTSKTIFRNYKLTFFSISSFSKIAIVAKENICRKNKLFTFPQIKPLYESIPHKIN
jgi:hypothetical protein